MSHNYALFMEILSGVVGTGIVLGLLGWFSVRYRAIRAPLIIGGVLRVVLAWIIGLRFAIPGTGADEIRFERYAYHWSQLPWSDLMAQFDPSRAYIISWLGAIIYKVFGRSYPLLDLFTVLFGIWLIVLTYRLTETLFGRSRAIAAAWVVSLFPFTVLWGSMFLREAIGSAFFMLGLLYGVQWVRTHSLARAILAMAMFAVAGSFHGGFAFAIVGMLIFAARRMIATAHNLASRRKARRFLSAGFTVAIILAGLMAVVAAGVTINKFGDADQISVRAGIEQAVSHEAFGGSAYPGFLQSSSPFSNPAVIVGRLIYFMLAPFPWDIRSPGQALGFIATIMYALIVRSMIRSRKAILGNEAAMFVLLATAIPVIVFGVAVDNIGTAIRHRTKFIYAMLALCAVPLLRKRVRRRRQSGDPVFP